MSFGKFNEKLLLVRKAYPRLTHSEAQKKTAALLRGESDGKFFEGVPAIATRGKISAHSNVVVFKDSAGALYVGYYQQYLVDINSPGLTVKAADFCWHTLDNVTVNDVVGFYL